MPQKWMLISGSHRKKSNSMKVAQYISLYTKEKFSDLEIDTLDLSQLDLPLWNEDAWEKDSSLSKKVQNLSSRLAECHGYVVIAPEYAGMSPSHLKNFFLYMGGATLAHKPALICTVSSGMGGAYPAAELRLSSFKNNRICYIPEQILIRGVEKILNSAPGEGVDDVEKSVRERLHYCIGILYQYSSHMISLRESLSLQLDKFPFGQ